MAYEINALDYGLIATDPGRAAQNAQAIAAAFSEAPRVYLPDGQTFYSEQITVPSVAKKMFGAATLILAGALPPAGSGAVNVATGNGLVLEDLTVQVDTSAYPAINGIAIGNSTGTELRSVTASGACGIIASGGNEILIHRCNVPSFSVRGIISTANKIRVRDCKVVGGAAGSSHGISIASCDDIIIDGCTVLNTVGFGICVEESTHFSIINNYAYGTVPEGINVTNSSWGQIRGNKSLPYGSSTDFGMSLSGQQGGQVGQVIVEGNIVDYAAKACLALAENVQWCKVIGNSFISPFQYGNAGGQFPNEQSAVVLYGPSCQFNEVSENMIRDLTGNMQWHVIETNFANLGAPDYNKLGPHRGIPGSLGASKVIGPHSQAF